MIITAKVVIRWEEGRGGGRKCELLDKLLCLKLKVFDYGKNKKKKTTVFFFRKLVFITILLKLMAK